MKGLWGSMGGSDAVWSSYCVTWGGDARRTLKFSIFRFNKISNFKISVFETLPDTNSNSNFSRWDSTTRN